MEQRLMPELIGQELEYHAKDILEREFECTEWVSKKNPTAPFDFLCIDNSVEYKIDVKSCLSRTIFLKKGKYQQLKNGHFGNFYFLLHLGNGIFHLLSFKKVESYYRLILASGGYKNLNFKKSEKILPCEKCGSRYVYYRLKTKDWMCRSCIKNIKKIKGGKDEK